jgi:hypothetical protein
MVVETKEIHQLQRRGQKKEHETYAVENIDHRESNHLKKL